MYEILNITDFSHVSLFSYFCNPKKAGAGGGGREGVPNICFLQRWLKP